MKSEPSIQAKPGFKIIGIERYTENGMTSIQEAWTEFTERSGEIKNLTTPVRCFGCEDYTRDCVMNPGEFPKYYYIASYEVTNFDYVPDGMWAREIPAANYAIFHYRGALGPELHEFFKYIYFEWLPTSTCKMDPNVDMDFEYYPTPITDINNVALEIWVPVVNK